MKFKRHKMSPRHKTQGSRGRPKSLAKAGDKTAKPTTEEQINEAFAKRSALLKKKSLKKRKKEELGGDTPREFLQLMSRMDTKGKSKVDESDKSQESSDKIENKKDRKQKNVQQKAIKKVQKLSSTVDLKIRPGESMTDFNRRVNEAIPIIRAKTGVPSAGAVRRAEKRERAIVNGAKLPSLLSKKSQTTTNPGDTDIDDATAERLLGFEDEEDEERTYLEFKSKRSRSPDPWKSLSRPPAPKFGEVAEAPPQLKALTKKLPNVPKSAGSIAQRMILESERDRVIAEYRAKQKRKMIGSERRDEI
ncbi:hypothetical protein V1511DRAFT_329726 [Dipodascopsis uninucleata]